MKMRKNGFDGAFGKINFRENFLKNLFKAFNSSSINGNKGMSLVSVSLFSGVISIVIRKLLMVADET